MNTNLNNKDFFEINQSGKNFKIHILTQKDVDSLISKNEVIQLRNKVFSSNSLSAFKLKDGQIIVLRQGETEFPIYPSEEVLLNQLTSHDSNPKEIFDGINIYGEDFPKKAEILLKEFLQKGNIKYNEHDNSRIIHEVDLFINKNRTKKFLDENFLSLVSLIGELVNRKYGSKWAMVKSKKNNVWTPFLSKDEQKIFFADFIMIDFDNKNLKTPISESYHSVVDIIKFNSKF